ncbi:MAG: flavin reductase family protein [Candidatus Sumerlaeia bacterium]|nr:flavin reductase family protein [Candidatus Sumerlaeia bacterium]
MFTTLEMPTLSIKDRYFLMTSVIVPRPIALVTSWNKERTVLNAAPFSFFNGVSTEPPLIMLGLAAKPGAEGGLVLKDSTRNILETQEFVVNICSREMAPLVTRCGEALPPEVSEVDREGLALVDSVYLHVPRIALSPVQLECRLYQDIQIGANESHLILGEVLCVHVQEHLWKEGRFQGAELDPLARLDAAWYGTVGERFKA